MECCKYCEIFSNSYDDLLNKFEDVESNNSKHFCIVYPNGIPTKIYDCQKNCVYFVEKRGDNERKNNG